MATRYPSIAILISLLIIILAIITVTFNISPSSVSSVFFTIDTNPPQVQDGHHHHQQHVHQHKPTLIRPDSNKFGLTATDKFISYSGYGRLSNNLIMLGHAVEASKLTGRKILVYPPSARLGDNQFSLSWLQLLNINAINAQLNPSQRPCLIQGFNYGEPNPAILEYIYNGTLVNARDECDENINDAPWQLRDPNSWSTDCYLLPWALVPHIASDINDSIPLITTKLNRAEHEFPGNGSCSKLPLQHQYHLIESGLDPVPTVLSLSNRLVLMTGDAMYHCDSLSSPDLPPSLHIELIANSIISDHSKPVLCMHVRRSDLSIIPLTRYIESANDLINSSAIQDVVIITDASSVELTQLRSGINRNISLGCDLTKYTPCQNSEDIRAAIEQQVCAISDFFIGSPESTFSSRVLDLRRQRGLVNQGSIIKE